MNDALNYPISKSLVDSFHYGDVYVLYCSANFLLQISKCFWEIGVCKRFQLSQLNCHKVLYRVRAGGHSEDHFSMRSDVRESVPEEHALQFGLLASWLHSPGSPYLKHPFRQYLAEILHKFSHSGNNSL